ncbi:MAG: Uma2 family endonuclease, partial [Candidatus Eremiobacterota bacterium]
GEFDGLHGQWLRWTDRAGRLLETGTEARAREQARADQAQARADQEQARADQEAERRMRLEAKLRELGIDPDS